MLQTKPPTQAATKQNYLLAITVVTTFSLNLCWSLNTASAAPLNPIIYDDYIEYPAINTRKFDGTRENQTSQRTSLTEKLPSSEVEKSLLDEFNHLEKERSSLLQQLDINKDGKISTIELHDIIDNLQLKRLSTLKKPIITDNHESNKPSHQMQQRFDRLDTDKNGLIAADEINTKLHLKFIKIDTNKDNLVSPSEFKNHILTGKSFNNRRKEKIILSMFKKRDTNKDDFISLEELNPRLRGFIKQKDLNADGYVNFQEFSRTQKTLKNKTKTP